MSASQRLRPTRAKQEEIARNYLGTMLKDLDRQERKLRKQERIALEIARQRLSIPQGLELERHQRYETAIKREMRRTSITRASAAPADR